ncbi:hypothetical protein [Aquimarina agarilytica]|uniref:hypothetical protein n=1 Tax=Aquimarina agarilytica TaxID=1087449 RepID=UPI0002890721|nr:hypothetical protein [Aquimarina agarilytica]
MEIKYDLIRIGSKRKNVFYERELNNSIKSLKDEITEILKEEYLGDVKKIELTIIKPARGLKAKFNIDNIKDKDIRKILKSKFSTSLRRLTDKEIQNNLWNINI